MSSECQGDGAEWVASPVGPVAVEGVDVNDRQAISTYEVHVCGNPWKVWVFLRLLTGDGLEGVGECSLNGFAKTTVACFEELSRYFLGKRPEDYATITRRMLTDLYSDAGQLHRGVVAAVELACLDILGKRAGLPVYALLGSKVRDEIRAYGNGWYRVERSVGGFTRAAAKAFGLGYDILKCDPFGAETSPLSPENRDLVEDIITALGHNAFDEGLFALECHQRLDLVDAHRIAREMSPVRWLWMEEPFTYWQLLTTARFARQSKMTVACGENLQRVADFAWLATESADLVLQPDAMNIGGLTNALQVCEIAESNGLRVCPHDAQGPVSRAACVQLAALSPAVWLLEDFDPWNAPWTREIATTFRADRGTIRFKDMSPGLGVTIHWEKVREHPYNPHGWVPLFETGWEHRRGEDE